MEENRKREFRIFTLTDYEKEEEYLRRMGKQGWRFVKVTLPGFYYFERCTPEDVVYKLDFRPLRGENKDAFLSIYRDYGWEHMQDINDFSYFRKPAGEAKPEDLEIFSDNESKFSMVKRMFAMRMIPLLLIFICCALPVYVRIFSGALPLVDGWDFIFGAVWGVLLAAYLYIFIHCGVGFYRLWRKYSKEE